MSKAAKKEVQQAQSININGKDYLVDSLSDQTKRLLAIHSKWQADEQALQLKASEAQLELLKTQTAIRSISDEIVRSVPQPVEVPQGETETPAGDTTVEPIATVE